MAKSLRNWMLGCSSGQTYIGSLVRNAVCFLVQQKHISTNVWCLDSHMCMAQNDSSPDVMVVTHVIGLVKPQISHPDDVPEMSARKETY